MGTQFSATVQGMTPLTGQVPMKVGLAGAVPAPTAIVGQVPMKVGLAGAVPAPTAIVGQVPMKVGLAGAVLQSAVFRVAGQFPAVIGFTSVSVLHQQLPPVLAARIGLSGLALAHPWPGPGPDPGAPLVTLVSPAQGGYAGNTVAGFVDLTGRGFTGAYAVYFGEGNPVQFTVYSDTWIDVQHPTAGQPCTVDVIVVTPAGVSVATTNTKFTFTP